MSAGLLFLLLRRTSTASSRSQCSVPDPNGKPKIRAVPAGPQLQARDRSRPRRTGAASPRSERSPPDPNSNLWIKVTPAGPQLWARDRSGPCGARTARSQWSPPDPNSNLWIKVIPAGLRPDVFTWFGLTDQIWANNRRQVEWNELVS